MAKNHDEGSGEGEILVGFLHLGSPTHGVSRFGRILAEGIRRHGQVAVVEEFVDAIPLLSRCVAVWQAAGRLDRCDVVHIQYNVSTRASIWGRRWRQAVTLWLFGVRCRTSLVVTLHDLPEASAQATQVRPTWRRRLGRAFRWRWDVVALRWLRRRAKFIVSFEEERRRLRVLVPAAEAVVIPHFVELRSALLSRPEARARLGLQSHHVILVVGYIHRRKGHALVVEALSQLPSNVLLVFAGRPVPGGDQLVEELTNRTAEIADPKQLLVTGYLADEDLDAWLSAADLAVCPFRSMSASGSLSTLIAAAQAVLISDLPQVVDYERLVPGALRVFMPRTATALADAIKVAIKGSEEQRSRVRQLATLLSLAVLAPRFVDVYRRAVRQADRTALI